MKTKAAIQKQNAERWTIPDMISIHQRTAKVADRTGPGNRKGAFKDHKLVIVTLVETGFRYVIITRLKADDVEGVRKAFDKAMVKLPASLAKILTYDREKEMSEYKQFTINTKIQVYFCDTHSPWQCSINENTNGLVRNFWPKGTYFDKIKSKEVAFFKQSFNDDLDKP